MNLKDTLESLIVQAMADEQELIPTHELPAAKVIAQRIEALEKALQKLISASNFKDACNVAGNHDKLNFAYEQYYNTLDEAKKVLDNPSA